MTNMGFAGNFLPVLSDTESDDGAVPFDNEPPSESDDDDNAGFDDSFRFDDSAPVVPEVRASEPAATEGAPETVPDGASDKVGRLDVSDIVRAERADLLRKKRRGDDGGGSSSEDGSGSVSDDDSDGDSDDDGSDGSASVGEDDNVREVETSSRRRRGFAPAEGGASSGDDDDGSDASEASEDEDAAEARRAHDFFDGPGDAVRSGPSAHTFFEFPLPRPLLRALADLGFASPTEIQARALPPLLAGRDVCGSAVTGSGKTAAYLLPALSRVLRRPRHPPVTRVAVLVPTRELAVQGTKMCRDLATYTDLRAEAVHGGAGSADVRRQGVALRGRPDVLFCTPGRILDHLANTAGFHLDGLEVLVLDEADRLLDMGFVEEVTEILSRVPVVRQTLLFSATFNTRVGDLVKLSLKRPVRVRVTSSPSADGDTRNVSATGVEVAPRIVQEFIRIRPQMEHMRTPIILSLLCRTYKASEMRTIVFFETKATCHRFAVLAGLKGIPCTELHGSLSQAQRLSNLQKFKDGDASVLLATNLAGRGLDVPDVDAVINVDMPSTVESYIHRIGRTARAGRGGRSCTLIGEGRRNLMKEVLRDAARAAAREGGGKKGGAGTVRSRAVPPGVVAHYTEVAEGLEASVRRVLAAEAVARADAMAQQEAGTAENRIRFGDEIRARPAREWPVKRGDAAEEPAPVVAPARSYPERKETGKHRMSRKKRRNDETRRATSEYLAEERRNAADEEAGGDIPEKRKKKKKPQPGPAGSKNKERKRRAARPEAPGDAGVFEEANAMYSAPKNTKKSKKGGDGETEDDRGDGERPLPSRYKFEGFDPDKKLGKRKGSGAFKSKAKYKRK